MPYRKASVGAGVAASPARTKSVSCLRRSRLFFRALSRTPLSPCDILAPLRAGWVLGSMLFSSVRDLPSAASASRVSAPVSVAFPLQAHGRHPDCVFRRSNPGPPMPLSTLHPAPRGARRKTWGRDGSLLLSCGLFHPRLHAGLSRRWRSLTRGARLGPPTGSGEYQSWVRFV